MVDGLPGLEPFQPFLLANIRTAPLQNRRRQRAYCPINGRKLSGHRHRLNPARPERITTNITVQIGLIPPEQAGTESQLVAKRLMPSGAIKDTCRSRDIIDFGNLLHCYGIIYPNDIPIPI